MNLLDIKPPVYSRVAWMTQKAKDRWFDPLNAINNAWTQVERALVLSGGREACQQPLSKSQYEEAVQWAEAQGLNIGVVRIVKKFQGFSHKYEETTPDDPNSYFVTVITKDPSLCAAFISKSLTDEEQGNAFGYPTCCQKFFQDNFPKYIDPMWQVSKNSDPLFHGIDEQYKLSLVNNPFTNPFIRYAGIRLINYIPCSMECKNSIEYGLKVLEVFKSFDKKLAVDLVILLSMNLEWSALKGLAIVKTPIMQLCSGSVPCYPKHTIQLVQSDPLLAYPEGSASGVGFPYRSSKDAGFNRPAGNNQAEAR